MRVSQGQMIIEIDKLLQQYCEEVYEVSQEASIKTGELVAERLKKTSPKRVHGGKHYADGWVSEKTPTGTRVRNVTKPTLTVLLERGHAKKNGGRVKARKHIRPAELWGIQEYLKMVKAKL